MAKYGIRFHAIPFAICAVAYSGLQVRRLMYWAGSGSLLLVALVAMFGEYPEGRLGILDSASLANPNDLAITLLLVSVYLLTLAYHPLGLVRMVPLFLLPLSLYYVLATGSRANFLTIVVTSAAAFVLGSRRVKMGLVAVLPLLMVALVLAVPASTWARLTSIALNPREALLENADARFAVGSQLARTELQRYAILLTVRNPLSGVGPLMFADAADEMIRADTGSRSLWQGAHNVYLQVAAENGVIACGVFIYILGWCIRTNYRSHKQAAAMNLTGFQGHTYILLLVTITYSFGILFGNYAYDPSFPVLVGLTAANATAIRSAMTEPPAQVGLPVPSRA